MVTQLPVPRRTAILAILCLAVFTINLDTTIVNVAAALAPSKSALAARSQALPDGQPG
jgi:hypothetical protein